MLLLDTDPVALWSLIVAIISGFIALVAAVAAIYAAAYAKEAPTKKDLAEVAENTSHLEEMKANISRMDDRLHKQHEHDAIVSQAQRVSITVQGMGDGGAPLPLDLLIRDHDVVLLRLEFYNEVGVLLGSADCVQIQPLAYKTVVDGSLVERWFGAGRSDGFGRRLLGIRAYMSLRGQEVYRHFPVYMTQGSRNVNNLPGVIASVYIVDGNV